ncbi:MULTISPECIES: hypothetical protein [Bacillus]|uniref:Uncharacterized protein n=1 Tax=Bacillus thuringiensis DB27 TaxID=1431339 RepID=W8YMI7_BACTU|nr:MULTISPECIES: hypothetical protein [Bacillus cereus group]MED2996707.1 hypothetical protein [Bacillus tropicus]CDN39631.1 unnamed protein product [Bacillus thuringiensis DB27]
MFHEGALPVSSDERSNCCKPATCQCQSCNGDSPDPHFFSYSIDVGFLQSEATRDECIYIEYVRSFLYESTIKYHHV